MYKFKILFYIPGLGGSSAREEQVYTESEEAQDLIAEILRKNGYKIWDLEG